MHSFPTDHRFGQLHESFMDVIAFFVSRAKSAVLVHPTQCSLDRPAIFAKAAAVRSIASSQNRPTPTLSQRLAMWVRMIRSVTLNRVEAVARSAWLARHHRH